MRRIKGAFGGSLELERSKKAIEYALKTGLLICADPLEPGGSLTFSNAPKRLEGLQNLFEDLLDVSPRDRVSRVSKRIAVARFYSRYKLALENDDAFLKWTEQCNAEDGKIAFKSDALVPQRFADILSSISPMKLRQACIKINRWQGEGKLWLYFIEHLGYGSLFLVPDELTDDR